MYETLAVVVVFFPYRLCFYTCFVYIVLYIYITHTGFYKNNDKYNKT